MFRITEKRFLNDTVVLMKIEAPRVAAKAKAGQFIIFRVDEYGERVPLTVADTDPAAGTVTVIFQIVGFSTRLLSERQAGESIADFVGPLGNATEYGEPKSAVVVGGGVGCAIAYPQAKTLHGRGVATDVIVGFRTKDLVILEDEFRAVSDRLFLTTDDGSYGEKGFVTDVLRRRLAEAPCDLVIAIGPVPMMKFVSETTKPFGVKTIVSLNPVMIDGTGMCGGCRVTVGGKTKFACVDGPDFDGHQVDFDGLMKRNRFYAEEEKEARNHPCRLFGGVK